MGCDPARRSSTTSTWSFQSTHPSGVRLGVTKIDDDGDGISIHAPQWGATRHNMRRISRWKHFNPRTPVGCDALPKSLPVNGSLFQSTHPSGVRLSNCCWTLRIANFNPRTPVGCDATGIAIVCVINNFNPRTPVGCDKTPAGMSQWLREFQSTHPSGVRPARQART